METSYVLFGTFVLLQVVDVVLTIKALKLGGREVNPLLRKAFEKYGVVESLVVVKAAMIGVVAAFLPMLPQWLMLLFVAVYLWVAQNNYGVVKKLSERNK